MTHPCPVCGFAKLKEPPRTPKGGGSFEICPSCGFQFGVSDDDGGFSYEEWRKRWKKAGMKWSSVAPAPKNWNPELSLKSLAGKASAPAQPKKK